MCRQWPSKAGLAQDTAPTTCFPCFWSWPIRLSSSTSEAEKLLPMSMKVGKLPCTAWLGADVKTTLRSCDRDLDDREQQLSPHGEQRP